MIEISTGEATGVAPARRGARDGASRTIRASCAGRAGDAASPILKWAGGKSRLLPQLLSLMPRRPHRYLEPFLGGGALFFRLAPTEAIVSDQNRNLVRTYQAVARDPDAVHAWLVKLARDWRESRDGYVEVYERVRDAWNRSCDRWPEARAAATFLFLNRTCFNGLWRVNRSGAFNVPVGDPPAGEDEDENSMLRFPSQDKLRSAARTLGQPLVHIVNVDFRATIAQAGADDFVYADPPYISSSGGFTGYDASGFGEESHEALADALRTAVRRGARVMASSSDETRAREIYGEGGVLTPHRVTVRRSIGAQVRSRGVVSELVFVGGYEPTEEQTEEQTEERAP